MGERCSNCGSTGADAYDLLVRGDEPTEAYLCDPCREALKDALETA